MTVTPRGLCDPETAFGRSPHARFRWDEEIKPQLVTAAIVQHRVAILVREQIAACDRTQEEYARDAQLAPTRLSLILGGHKRMSFTEFAVLSKTLGPSFTAAIDAREWVKVAKQPATAAQTIVPLVEDD